MAAVVPDGVLAMAAVVPEGVDEGGFVEASVDEKITPNHHSRKSTTPVIKMSAAIPRPISNPALIYSYSIFYFRRVKCPVFLCCPISMVQTWLISFGTETYQGSLELLRHSALKLGGIDRVILYTPDNIRHDIEQDPEFYKQRGFGFWSWKPKILYNTLVQIPDGDIIVYCDSTMMFQDSVEMFRDVLKDTDILLFRLGEAVEKGYTNRHWTKHDLFVSMECDTDIYKDAYQLNAAIQIYKKSASSLQFVKEYAELCLKKSNIDDACILRNDPGFVSHRHDQSVLSLLSIRRRGGVVVLRDPTQHGTRDPVIGHPRAPVETMLNHHRQLYDGLVKTTVITPTLDGKYLDRCIRSVQDQLLPCVEHMIVVDGPNHVEHIHGIVKQYEFKNTIHIVVLPYNTGANWYNGHRVYASFPALCNSDYVTYLDDDNWYDENHLSDLMGLVIEKDLDWSYSLRSIVDRDSCAFLCDDNCESLGTLCKSVINDYFIDTNVFLLKREVAVAVGPTWFAPGRTDRPVSRHLMTAYPKHGCSRKHSLKYGVVENKDKSVGPSFFVRGNALFGYDFENKPDIFIFHFMPEKTREFLMTRNDMTVSHALKEWQMTLLRDVAKRYNCIDGYRAEHIPPGSTVLVTMCFPECFPMNVLKRTDLRRIGFTLESPNIRHQQQWDSRFLKAHFDHILTYWTPLLRDTTFATFCPHNTHHLDFDNSTDMLLFKNPFKTGKNVCMVLERRDLQGPYVINGIQLRCQDTLREHYVQDLEIDVYGKGWEKYTGHPTIHPKSTSGRGVDTRTSVDIIGQYTFVVIIENTNADGYVSEKIYDSFIAGTIPIYHGNNNEAVGIPHDMYIDLKTFDTSQKLAHFLNEMTPEDIRGYQERIAKHRHTILQKVSTKSFADILDTVVRP